MRKNITKVYIGLTIALAVYGIWYAITGVGIPCFYLSVQGYECPGCGLSRMIYSIITFDFVKAFFYNPVGFVAFWIWNAIALLCFTERVGFVKKRSFVYSMLAFTVAAFLIQGLIRNLY